MVNSADAAAIVNSVVGLGRTMGLRVVAEGVESQDQVTMLRSIGCHEIQGYLFGKPLAAKNYDHVTRPRPRPAAPKKGPRRAPQANSGR